MAKKYTFTVTATLRDGDNLTREEALEELRDWLKEYKCCSVLPGTSSFNVLEIE